MEAAGRRPIDVGRVIGESFDLYRSNAGALLGSAVVVFAIAGILQGLFQEAGGFILPLAGALVSLVANALYTGFVVNVVADVRTEGSRGLTAGELFSRARHAIWPLIGNGILKGIAVVIGFILLIVPGLILLTIWAVTSPAIVVEKQGVVDAFGRSHELVRGQAWSVFATMLVAFLIVMAIGVVAVAIGAAIGLLGVILLATVAGILTAPIPALVSSILFYDLGGGEAASPVPAEAPLA